MCCFENKRDSLDSQWPNKKVIYSITLTYILVIKLTFHPQKTWLSFWSKGWFNAWNRKDTKQVWNSLLKQQAHNFNVFGSMNTERRLGVLFVVILWWINDQTCNNDYDQVFISFFKCHNIPDKKSASWREGLF